MPLAWEAADAVAIRLKQQKLCTRVRNGFRFWFLAFGLRFSANPV